MLVPISPERKSSADKAGFGDLFLECLRTQKHFLC